MELPLSSLISDPVDDSARPDIDPSWPDAVVSTTDCVVEAGSDDLKEAIHRKDEAGESDERGLLQ